MRKATRRQRWALTNPITLAISGARITDDERLNKLRMLELQAIDAFVHGRATVHDWRAIADVSNLAQTMCEMGIGPEVLEPARIVESVLGASHAESLRTGNVATDEDGIAAMRDLFAFHDLQRSSVDRSTYERAIVKTANRIRSAHPSLKVCVSNPRKAIA